jgi:hypothetical protein
LTQGSTTGQEVEKFDQHIQENLEKANNIALQQQQ